MQGILDDRLRDHLTALGGVDYCVSEFARVSFAPLSDRGLLKECPELQRGGRTASGVPVYLQLLGGLPGPMAASAREAARLGATVIDLNFGCPVGRVTRNDGGAALLRDPDRLRSVTAAVREAVPDAVLVSAKLRLGWEDPSDAVALARAAEAGGAAWLTIHARTRVQAYAGRADWTWIARVREAVQVPVVANGDITTPEELERCAAVTGCDRFMIGRGALARPETFRVLRGQDAWWPSWRRLALLQIFLDRLEAERPGHDRAILGRVKGWAAYMATADEAIAGVFESLKRAQEVAGADQVLRAAVERLRG